MKIALHKLILKKKTITKNVILDIFVIGNEIKDITVDISSLSDYEEISKNLQCY